jgi:chaperonin cofactor prefoldin
MNWYLDQLIEKEISECDWIITDIKFYKDESPPTNEVGFAFYQKTHDVSLHLQMNNVFYCIVNLFCSIHK